MNFNIQFTQALDLRFAEAFISREAVQDSIGIVLPYPGNVRSVDDMSAAAFFRLSRGFGLNSHFFFDRGFLPRPPRVRSLSAEESDLLGSYEELMPEMRQAAREQMRRRSTSLIEAHIAAQIGKLYKPHGREEVVAILADGNSENPSYNDMKAGKLIAAAEKWGFTVEQFFDGLGGALLPPLMQGQDLAARSFLVDANILRIHGRPATVEA